MAYTIFSVIYALHIIFTKSLTSLEMRIEWVSLAAYNYNIHCLNFI